MKRIQHKYHPLSLLAFLIFAILVFLQAIWLYKAIQIQQEEMELQLEKLIPNLALDINSLGHHLFHNDSVNLNDANFEEIEQIVKNHLDSNQINNIVYFSLFKNEDHFISNKNQYKKELIQSKIKSCISCIISFSILKENPTQLPHESNTEYSERLAKNSSFQYYAPVQNLMNKKEEIIWFTLYQPHSFSDALKSMIYLFGTSIILIIILLGLFQYLLRLLSNYKKVTQIKEDFFNNMTHEFKTPLSSIRLASRVLRKNHDIEKSKLYHDIIEKESKNLELQIDKLLDFSLLDNNENKLDFEVINLHELISEVPQKLKVLIDNKKAEILLDLQSNKYTIQGDYYHLSNSISNLVENSLKYNNENITIWISTYPKNNSLYISVKDNGIGIEPQFQAHIFNRFYRANKNNQYKTQGFGIGLSYVKNIVESHKGKIQINSNYQNGCEFIIQIPLLNKNK